MRGRTTILVGLTTLLVALTLWVSVPITAAITGSITLTINCTGNPETTAITNNTDETLDLTRFTLTTLFQPRENEPFRLTGTLAPGATRTLQSGTMAPATDRLTGQFIYENEEASEGALLSTPFGPLQVLCSARTATLQVAQQPASPTATSIATTPTAAVTAVATVAATATTAAPTATTAAPTATMATTATAEPTRAATVTAVPTSTLAPVPTATMVLPGMPRTGVGGAGLGLGVGPLAALMAAIILFGAFASRERRRR